MSKCDKVEELSAYDLRHGRMVTIVRGHVSDSGNEDHSFRGEKLKVLAMGYGVITLERPSPCKPITLSLEHWGFADASILDKPKIVWITTDEIKTEAAKSKLAAVEVSIKKYRQILEASDEELAAKGRDIIYGNYCGLCYRFSSCDDCPLDGDMSALGSRRCCPEWICCIHSWGDWPVFRQAVQKLLERLEKERDKLLKKQQDKEKYVFVAADIAVNPRDLNGVRVIVSTESLGGKLKSFGLDGLCESEGQKQFESNNYVRIGTLKDYLGGLVCPPTKEC